MINLCCFLASNAVCGEEEITANVWFLIDGSPSVSEEEFRHETDFAKHLASKLFLDEKPNKTRFGLSAFASKHVTYLNFSNERSLQKFNESADTAMKPTSNIVVVG